MKKLVRPTYPAEFSIGILLLIFAIAFLLSHQIFHVPISEMNEDKSIYFGMFLVGVAVIIMVLIMWEELLFPIKVKEVNGGMVFRNHRKKLKVQSMIYCAIPAIFTFIYFEYDINPIRFAIWAAVCMVPPVLEKIVSGINNYNDFLKLTDQFIEYKNNEKEGKFDTSTIENITVMKDDHKILLSFKNSNSIVIDLDEMELDDYYYAIYKYLASHFKHLLKEIDPSA